MSDAAVGRCRPQWRRRRRRRRYIAQSFVDVIRSLRRSPANLKDTTALEEGGLHSEVGAQFARFDQQAGLKVTRRSDLKDGFNGRALLVRALES